MPALVWLPNPEDINRFLHGWKRMSSFRIRQWYAAHAANYFAGFGPGERFWQPKSYVFHVHSERKLREKLDYMHINPVKAGLVKCAAGGNVRSKKGTTGGRRQCEAGTHPPSPTSRKRVLARRGPRGKA